MLICLHMADCHKQTPPRRYANWLEIAYSQDEFVLDFGQIFDEEEPVVHTGIVTTPRKARDFLDTLQQALDDHQRRYPQGSAERE